MVPGPGDSELQPSINKRLRQEDPKFGASLGYLMRPCQKIKVRRVWESRIGVGEHGSEHLLITPNEVCLRRRVC